MSYAYPLHKSRKFCFQHFCKLPSSVEICCRICSLQTPHTDIGMNENEMNWLGNVINSTKLNYHERVAAKLGNSKVAPEAYWSILKMLANFEFRSVVCRRMFSL